MNPKLQAITRGLQPFRDDEYIKAHYEEGQSYVAKSRATLETLFEEAVIKQITAKSKDIALTLAQDAARIKDLDLILHTLSITWKVIFKNERSTT